jgi:hypothetical protein
MTARWVVVCAAFCAGCASSARFVDRPVVWQVDDSRDIPEPEAREFVVAAYAADIFALRPLEHVFELRSHTPARNTNSLDEVPNSTWFQNRIGVRRVSPVEAARGPDVAGPPRLPLTVLSGKNGGGNAGFVAQDADHRRFVVKFDAPENPELQTANAVIVNRFFWTIGYNVPVDHVFTLRATDIVIAHDAYFENAAGDRAPFTQAALGRILRHVPARSDGILRATSSEFVKGKPKGAFAMEGVRADDPNDAVPHEHRRELRGLRVFSAWLDHTDIKEDNTLDAWVGESGRHFLRHYLLDFGEALGGHAAEKHRYEDGYEHYWDWEAQSRALVSLGLWARPWERRRPLPFLSVGSLATSDFDPRRWREAYPYAPFAEMDAADAYWAAKIVMRFDRKLIEALVATGKLSDPVAARYLVYAIEQRRDRVGRAFLGRVTDLDGFHTERGRICAWSLLARYGLVEGGTLEVLDERGHTKRAIIVGDDGRVCLPVQPDAYTVVRLRMHRGPDRTPPMQLHVKHRTRVLGIVRVG